MSEIVQAAIDGAYAKALNGMKIAEKEPTVLGQALAVTLTLGQVMRLLQDHVCERVRA